MNEMTTYKLGDIAKFVNGRAYLLPEMLSCGKYRIVRVGNFTGKDEWYYSDMELDPDKYCESGDLLYKWACTFGPEIWTAEKAIYHYHIWKVIPDERYIDKDYLFYLLGHMTAQWMKAVHGSTMVHITKEVMEQNAVVIPTDVRKQSEIAQVLKTIDRKITNNYEAATILEAQAKLLYDYWFVQFDFPDENGKPYKSSGGKMVWNEKLKREIPEGWETGKLESRISLERGISYSTANLQGEGISMINLGSFAIGGGYKDGNLKNYNGDYPDNKRIKPYDMVMCLTQQTSIDPSKDVIGCVMLVPDIFNDDIVISQDLTKILCEENLKLYLAQYFNTEYFHRYITGYASGSNILHLDVNGVLKHTTYFPSNTLLKRFGEMIKPMWEKHSQIMAENQQLASLRDFLLPMLMNGQVKVGKESA